jgi:CBS domain-containing protein
MRDEEGGEMKCSELMKTEPQCAKPSDTAAEVAERMRDRNVGFVPVCGAAGEVLGTITDRDLAIRVVAARSNPESTLIEEVMSREAITCRASDDIEVAEELMSRHKKSRIMCTDDAGKLVGVISLSDIAEVEQKGKAAAILRSVAQRESHALVH